MARNLVIKTLLRGRAIVYLVLLLAQCISVDAVKADAGQTTRGERNGDSKDAARTASVRREVNALGQIIVDTSTVDVAAAQAHPGNEESPLARPALQPEPLKLRPLMSYFRSWSLGAIASRHGETAALPEIRAEGLPEALEPDERVSVAHLHRLLEERRAKGCPGEPGPDWFLHEAVQGEDGVIHAILRAPGHHMQYMAYMGDELIATDPHPCLGSSSFVEQSNHPAGTMDGDRLISVHDSSVDDCVQIFHRDAKITCNKTQPYDITLVRAWMEVIDGFKLTMEILVHKAGTSQAFVHQPKCVFQVDKRPPSELSQSEMTREEANGERATLIVGANEDLCSMDMQHGPGLGKSMNTESVSWFVKHGFGELSFYKGHEHDNDHIPRLDLLADGLETESADAGSLPESYSMLESHSHCFPEGGASTVKNQGTCGSCWAKASTSAAMITLCISDTKKKWTLRSSQMREEMSTQQLMVCNQKRRGCAGGVVADAHSVFLMGVTQESKIPYQCSSGDPLNHFVEHDSCPEYPWGMPAWTGARAALCNMRVPQWIYGGSYLLEGQSSMMRRVMEGYALYAGIDVYWNFLTFYDEDPTAVYAEGDGEIVGGHAVVIVGFGVKDGTPYWLCQNSWGPSWADHGFGRILRGKNFLRIETWTAVLFRFWVDDPDVEPPRCIQGMNCALGAAKQDSYDCLEACGNRSGLCPKICGNGMLCCDPFGETAVGAAAEACKNTADRMGWGGRRRHHYCRAP